MNRRDFILKAGAASACGVIPVSFYENCVEWLNHHGQPLLVPPPKPSFEIYALSDDGCDFQLHFGRPDTGVPTITWREYLEDCQNLDLAKISAEELEEEYGCSPGALNEDCPDHLYYEFWEVCDSSKVQAYRYLEDLDLAPGFVRGGRVVGSLEFIEGACPGNNYTAVHAKDAISLSCLQERLNQLGERAEIVTSSWDEIHG